MRVSQPEDSVGGRFRCESIFLWELALRQMDNFATTRWTVVLEANGSGEESVRALSQLAEVYWYPLYAFLRRSGRQPQDAEDTLQAFFAWMIESNLVGQADPERGRFRNFLMVSLRQFQARESQFNAAAKRSPQRSIQSLDAHEGELKYQRLSHNETAESLLQRAWANSLIELAMNRLREEMVRAEKAEQFDCLRGMITGQRDKTGREAAQSLGISEGAVRVTVHRMKRRYAAILREEVAATVDDKSDVDDELRTLIASISG